MMAPLTPHTAEEIWSRIGNKGFVVQADWPQESENEKDALAERAEAYATNRARDMIQEHA